MSIVTPESWHPNWPLQEADVPFLETGSLLQMKQSMRWVEYIGPEKQKGRLRQYIAKIAVNVWGCDLIQQWKPQIIIPAVPQTHVSVKVIIRYYKQRSSVIQVVQKRESN